MANVKRKTHHGKPCIKCASTLRYDDSNRCVSCRKSKDSEWYKKNKEKAKARNSDWYATNKETIKEKLKSNSDFIRKYKKIYNRKQRTGVSQEQYDLAFKNQKGMCPICALSLPESPATDHCHVTGRFRGLLHDNCNFAIGCFMDNVVYIGRAIAYLHNPPAKDLYVRILPKRSVTYKYPASTKEGKRERILKKRYGLTLAQNDKIFDIQGGCCAICKTANPGTNRVNFCIDHCHTTKAIRGLLCTKYNSGLGQIEDSAERLSKAMMYLSSNSKGFNNE